MNLIDTHAHLYWKSFEKDLEDVVSRSKEAGITTIINSGVDLEKSQDAILISKKVTSLGIKSYAIIGIHPHDAVKYTSLAAIQTDIEKLEQIYHANKDIIVGIGECGLDYLLRSKTNEVSFSANDLHSNINLSPQEIKTRQEQLFKTQIDLAKKLNLPLVIHCRDDRSQDPNNSEAWEKAIAMAGDHLTILHCYSGLLPTTNHIINTNNFIVSFAGNITYPKNDYLKEAARILPIERIILETDSPFLSPQSQRGRRNEPSAVLEIAQTIAQIKNIPFDQVANQTTKNAMQIYNIQFAF